MAKKVFCSFCENTVEKDVVALNKKLLGRNVKKILCLTCLADYMTCTEDDLIVKIDEFKEMGCTLFA